MPSRILRESILTSASLDSLSPEAERLFYRLLIVAEDWGRFQADPQILVSFCFPLKAGAITCQQLQTWLDELVVSGTIALYEVKGRRYGYFVNWQEHNKLRNKVSKFPDPPSANKRKQLQTSASKRAQLSTYTDTDTDTDKNPLPLSEKGEWLKSQILKVPNFVLSPPSPDGIEDLVRDFAPRYNGQFELNVKNAVTWALSPENRYAKKPDKAGCGVGFVRKWLTNNLPPEPKQEQEWKRL